MARKANAKPAAKPVEKPIVKPVEAAVKVEAPKTENVKTEDKAATTESAVKAEAPAAKKVSTKKATEKKAAEKKTPGRKPAVKLTTEIHVQFADKSLTQEDLVNIAKDVWKYDLEQKEGSLTSLELYVKPEERRAYYVMNKEFSGSFYI